LFARIEEGVQDLQAEFITAKILGNENTTAKKGVIL
jgi:hypothetical protein